MKPYPFFSKCVTYETIVIFTQLIIISNTTSFTCMTRRTNCANMPFLETSQQNAHFLLQPLVVICSYPFFYKCVTHETIAIFTQLIIISDTTGLTCMTRWINCANTPFLETTRQSAHLLLQPLGVIYFGLTVLSCKCDKFTS